MTGWQIPNEAEAREEVIRCVLRLLAHEREREDYPADERYDKDDLLQGQLEDAVKTYARSRGTFWERDIWHDIAVALHDPDDRESLLGMLAVEHGMDRAQEIMSVLINSYNNYKTLDKS